MTILVELQNFYCYKHLGTSQAAEFPTTGAMLWQVET